jgi:hypothetical protein
MSLLTDAEKTSLIADFGLAVNTWERTLVIYQEAQKTVVVSDPNWNPIEAWNQNNSDITNTPVYSTVSGRIMWDKQQEWKYMKPYAGQGGEAQIKVKDQTSRACRLKVDSSGYNLLLTAKKVEIDGVLMDPESQPRPHGLFTPNYWTFYFVRSM